MRMYLLSADKDTLTGMRLAGIDGEIIQSREEFEDAVLRATQNEEIGILLVAKTLASQYADEIIEIKKRGKLLVTQIPDMLDPTAASDSITRYVQEAVGISMD